METFARSDIVLTSNLHGTGIVQKPNMDCYTDDKGEIKTSHVENSLP